MSWLSIKQEKLLCQSLPCLISEIRIPFYHSVVQQIHGYDRGVHRKEFLFSTHLERERKTDRKTRSEVITYELQKAIVKTTGADLETNGNFANQFSARFLWNFNSSKSVQLRILQQDSKRPKKRKKEVWTWQRLAFFLAASYNVSPRCLFANSASRIISLLDFVSFLLNDYSMLDDCFSFALQILIHSFTLRNLCGTVSTNNMPIPL